MHAETVQVGKRGTFVIPSRIRKEWGIDDGSQLILELRENGELVVRRAVAIPVEQYTDTRRAEFLLNNAVDEQEYARALEEVRRMGLDPGRIPHDRPGREAHSTHCLNFKSHSFRKSLMNRLNKIRSAELRAWLFRNMSMIAEKGLIQSEAANLASTELGFEVTQYNIGYICRKSRGPYKWPNHCGRRSTTQRIVAAMPQVAVAKVSNGHTSILAQLKELSKLFASFDARLKRLEEVIG